MLTQEMQRLFYEVANSELRLQSRSTTANTQQDLLKPIQKSHHKH